MKRSMKPDGTKIRSLRLGLGKTQPQIIHGSQVQLRTYQRAEQGIPLAPETLRDVASLFNLPLTEVLKREAELEAESKAENVRLHSCDGKGGLKILRELQAYPGDVQFKFDIDPYSEVATHLGEFVTLCELHNSSKGSPAGHRLHNADFIEVVGELNNKIAQLYDLGVNVYFGKFYAWRVDSTIRALDSREFRVRYPARSSRLRFVFSERTGGMIREETIAPFESRSGVFQRAAKANLDIQIEPDAVEFCLNDMFFYSEPEFADYYSASWERAAEHFSAEGRQLVAHICLADAQASNQKSDDDEIPF